MRALRKHLIQKVMEADDDFTRANRRPREYRKHLSQFTDAEIQAELAHGMCGDDFED